MKMASAGNATRTESKTQRNRDLWFLLWPSVTFYLLGMVSIIWLDTPQSWWAAGIAFAGGTVLHVISLPVMAIGSLSQTEWLLWTGLVGIVLSILMSTGLDIVMVIRRRRRLKQ
jgi:hypothetical protein